MTTTTTPDLATELSARAQTAAAQLTWLAESFRAGWPEPQNQPKVQTPDDPEPPHLITLLWERNPRSYHLIVDMSARTADLYWDRPNDPRYPDPDAGEPIPSQIHRLDRPTAWRAIHAVVTHQPSS